MREAKEREAWASLKKSYSNTPANQFAIGGSSVDLAAACTVVSGRNGTGKSRLLRDLHAALGDSALLLDMHHLCEQALIILRSRTDLGEMAEEFEVQGPDEDRLDDIQRIVGRRYSSVEWYALEIEPDDAAVAAKFRWSGDESLIPYFRAKYGNLDYTSKDMGLGEFSVHFLFWILEQYREAKDLTLLLDEPDAYLPPVGVERLLARILDICLRRRWRVIISTHSGEMITRAVEEQALTVLRIDEEGNTVALQSTSTADVAAELLPRPTIDRVLFCEDESAWYLTRALLDAHDLRLSRATSVVWGNGHGYLRELHKFLPRPPQSELKFAYVFDGDQRGTVDQLDRRWPAVFLPSKTDPDTLFQDAASDPTKLAGRLGANPTSLQLTLDSIEADDAHDWVNSLGERYGRPNALRIVATLWVEQNPESTAIFAADLEAEWKGASSETGPNPGVVPDDVLVTEQAAPSDPAPRSLRGRLKDVFRRS